MKRLLLTIALAATTLTGCGGDAKPKEAPKGPEVAWAARACDTVKASGTKVALPATDRDPRRYKQNVVTFLDDLSARLKRMETGLRAMGAPPVANGRTTVDQALTRLTRTRASLETARTRLARARVTDDASLRRELGGLSKVMTSSAAYQGPTGDLRANPALTKALDAAPACRAK